MKDTHGLLIEAAARWLRGKGFHVVITDMSHSGRETPDAIGINGRTSWLVECKASVEDFRADQQKPFRRNPAHGMAPVRYYCAPSGLLKPEALPPKWGLLEWDGRRLREAVKAHYFFDYYARGEVSLLVSALRRVAHAAPRGAVSVKCYTMDSLCRATLGIDPLEDWCI